MHKRRQVMAEQKTKKTTRKPKEDRVTAQYKGKTYDVLEQNEHCTKLTDGMIHFWVRNKDVTVG